MSDDIYQEFAEIYTVGRFPEHSKEMVEVLPDIFEHFDFYPKRILDLACGEGTFAVKMAEKGYEITGVDASEEMLRFAGEKAEEEGVEVEFIKQDMRELSLEKKFDLSTCWFESLNYILEKEELKNIFENVHRLLVDDGIFIFDMNTLYKMKEIWTASAVVRK